MSEDCDCSTCQEACTTKPGWFLPDQVPALLDFLGKPLEEMLGVELSFDYWMEDDGNTYVLAPNIVGNANDTYPYEPDGRCVFFTDEGRCSIHDVKPFECREFIHGDKNVGSRHEAIAAAWRNQDGVDGLPR